MSAELNIDTPKVPALRFPEFLEELNTLTVKELISIPLSNGIFNDPKLVGSGYKLINVKDMYQGDQVLIENLSLVNIKQKEFEKNKAEFGDVFFTRSSLVKEGIAKSNINLSTEDDITYDGHLIKASFKSSELDPFFVKELLKTDNARRQLIARGKTGTRRYSFCIYYLSIPYRTNQNCVIFNGGG